MSPGGVSTGRVRVGRFTMVVGEPGGTTVTIVEGAAPQPPPELVDALGTAPQPPAEELEEAVEDVAQVTSKIERAVELFTLVAQRRVDPAAISKELDALLNLLGRLDRAGRFDEALRLARPLHGVLALALRWASLVEALRVALHAAEELVKVDAQGWVLHELGSLGIGAEDAHAAEPRLERARSLHERAGDRAGLRATEHNLATLRAAFPGGGGGGGGGGGLSRRTLAIAGASVLVLVILGFALAPALDDGTDTDTATTVATTTTPETTTTPPPPPAGDVVAPRVTIIAPQAGARTDPTLEIAGTAGSADGDEDSVRLTVHERSSDGVAAAGPLDVTRDGPDWATEVTLPLEPGTRLQYTAVATQRDAAGNVSEPATVTFVAYAEPDPPPPPTVTDPPPPPTVTDPPPPVE